jgi:hypothetical protein
MKATILRVNGTSQVVDVTPRPNDYAAIKAVVKPLLGMGVMDGFEHVTVWHNGKRTDMFVDEDGHAKLLHRNDAATEVYRGATMAGMTGEPIPDDPETLPWIAGDALLFEEHIWF